MFRKNGGIFELYPWKVKYTRNNEENVQWALPDKEWWTEVAEKTPGISGLTFSKVNLDPEQLERYDRIKDYILEGFLDTFIEYVISGEFPEVTQGPLKLAQIELKNRELEEDRDILATTIVEILEKLEEGESE